VEHRGTAQEAEVGTAPLGASAAVGGHAAGIGRDTPRGRWRTGLLVAVAYAAWAAALSWPGPAHLATRVIGDGGDAPLFLWNIRWVEGWVLGQHGLFETHQLFWPQGANLAWTTLALPASILAGMLVASGAGLVLAYNLVVLASLAADGAALYWCARRMGLPRSGAFWAGWIFLASPYFMGQLLGHLNLVGAWGIPLVVGWGWDLLARRQPAWWRFAVLGVLVALVAWSVYDYGIYATGALVAVWLAHPDLRGRRLAVLRAWWRGWLLAGGAAVVALAPLVAALLVAPLAVHGGAATPFYSPWVVDALSAVVPDPWGAFRFLAPAWHLAPDLADGSGFPGFGLWLGALGGVAILVHRRRNGQREPDLERLIWPLGALSALSAVLSLGSFLHVDGIRTPIPMPYILLADVPYVRDTLPERLAVLTALFGSLLTGVVLAWVARWARAHRLGWVPRALGATAVAGVVAVGSAPWPFADTALPRVPHPTAIRAAGGTTLYVPTVVPMTRWGAGIARFMYEAALIGTPTPDGYVSRIPLSTAARIDRSVVLGYLWGIAQTPDPETGLAGAAARALPRYLARHDVCSIVVDAGLLPAAPQAVGWLRAHAGAGWRVLVDGASWTVLLRHGHGCRT